MTRLADLDPHPDFVVQTWCENKLREGEAASPYMQRLAVAVLGIMRERDQLLRALEDDEQ